MVHLHNLVPVNILSWQDGPTGWKLGVDENYRGEFDSNVAYRLNDYVKVGDKVYQSKTNLTAGQFVPIQLDRNYRRS